MPWLMIQDKDLLSSLNSSLLTNLKECASWKRGTVAKIFSFPPLLKYINQQLLKIDRKRRAWIKFVIDKKEDHANVIHKIPNFQNRN